MERLRNLLKSEKGFTLIELLVVIIIIGVLASIAMPNLLGATDKAKEKRVLADLRVIETAIDTYYAENSEYPGDTDFKDKLAGTGKYLKEWPMDPWDEEYTYDKIDADSFKVTSTSTTSAVYLDETGIH